MTKKNKKSFEMKRLRLLDDQAIEILIKKAFKYVQEELKSQYKQFVVEKREEREEQIRVET